MLVGKDWRCVLGWIGYCYVWILFTVNCEVVVLVLVVLLMFYSCKLNLFNCVNDYVVLYFKNIIVIVDKMFI